ncbi:MAG: glycosyltransferase family 2 protein [Candidatus Hermodarchaeota archaeon]
MGFKSSPTSSTNVKSQNENLKKFITKYRPYVTIVIPAYNEAKNIGLVIDGVKKYSNRIIVVDDGSRDQTAEVAKAHGADVIQHARNSGKGKALRRGLKAALEFEKTRYIITLDSDNQHCPDDIPSLLAVLLREKADIVVGRRIIFDSKSQFMPPHRLWSNFVTSSFLRFFIGFKIRDVQSGYRCYRRKIVAKTVDSLKKSHFDMETEILLQAWLHYRAFITDAPVKMLYGQGEGSEMRLITDTWRWFITVLEKLVDVESYRLPLPRTSRFGAIGLILFELGFAFSPFLLALFV